MKFRVVFAQESFIGQGLLKSGLSPGLFDGHPYVDCDSVDMSGPFFAFSFPTPGSRQYTENKAVSLQCPYHAVLLVNEYNPDKTQPFGFAASTA